MATKTTAKDKAGKETPKMALSPEEEQVFMNTAPIKEVAEYLGVDLGLAVQLRVDEAVSAAYRKLWGTEQHMAITVRPIEPVGNLYGFASVTIGGIRIDDFKIVGNKDGELFVGMPSKPDKTSKTGYRSTIHLDQDIRESFHAAVIDKYYAAVEQDRHKAANRRSTPEPVRMCDQLTTAGQEAAMHNAENHAPEKGKTEVARGGR